MDKANNEMKIFVYQNELDGLTCPNCGEKIQLNNKKIDELIISFNNIIDGTIGEGNLFRF